MKQYGSAMICFVTLAFVVRQDAAFKDLQQLSGTWKMQSATRALYENWAIVSTNEMSGRSYLVQAADTTILEQVQLIQNKEGVFYNPTVKDQNEGKAVSFKLVSSAAKQFVFENRTHDFPQRVIYQLVNPDSVHAWIEGKKNGRNARSDYYYKRIGTKP